MRLTGSYKQGKDFSLLFDYNVNTEAFYDALQDGLSEAEAFPVWETDYREIMLYFRDFVDNWQYFGEPVNERWSFILKDGSVIYSDHYSDLKQFKKALAPIRENHFAAIIRSDDFEDLFWINGWQGAEMLQAYTGWFDFTLYDDRWL